MIASYRSGRHNGADSALESGSEHGFGEAGGAIPLAELQPQDGEQEDDEEKLFLPGQPRAKRYELYSPEEDRAVLKKLDRRLVLFMAFLYMLSFLDRSNIGNARIAGLTRDLNLSSAQYEWLLTAFYVAYICFQWMALMYRLVPPHIYISICVLSWGVLASSQSLTTSFSSLLIIRILLGVSEAAYGNGVPFYLSFFFRREELALRTGLFISAAPLATSFASSLAWLITKLGSYGPIAPWRLLFLVEGFPSTLVAIFAWHFVPDTPAHAPWLTMRERKVAVLRLRRERESAEAGKGRGRQGLDFHEIWQTLTDPKSYLTALMFFSCNVAFSSMPVFLPTIVHEMGYSALTSQALSAPPYLFSFAFVLLTAYLSDKHCTRSIYIMVHSLLGASGYLTLTLSGLFGWPVAIRYLALYPACVGFFSVVTLILTWTVNNQESDSGKGTGLTILGVVGQCGPLLGVQLFPDEDGPFYVKGMGTCAVFMLGVGMLAAVLRFVLSRENRRRLNKNKNARGEGTDADEDGEGPFLYMT